VTQPAHQQQQQQQQQPSKVDLRTQMPETAKWVDQQRQELGAAHVNGCIRRALTGEPGVFWAIERGHVLGTPFPSSSPIAEAQRMAVVTGATFAGFIALPDGGQQ